MITLKEYLSCPYNRNHILKRCKMQKHIPICREHYQDVLTQTCRFDSQRLSEEDPQFYCQIVSENVGTKSKRRRAKIKERHALKAQKLRNNELPRKSEKPDSSEKVLEMDNHQQEIRIPVEESAKKKGPRKNHSQAPGAKASGKANPAVETTNEISKSAMKRAKKKIRKQRGTARANAHGARHALARTSGGGEEYVITLNDSVTVTETYVGRKEVYIHYPTKKVMTSESVPKSGLGIQPMMLQKICFEAFMKMHYSSDGEGSGSSSANENENKNIRGSEIASGYTSSANDDENKTVQSNNEVASGVSPSANEDEDDAALGFSETASGGVVKKDNKTTRAPDGKRSKSKKNKKKYNLFQKGTSLYNSSKTTVEELERRNYYVKYMTSDPDDRPPTPPSRTEKRGVPAPYLKLDDTEFNDEIEESEYALNYEALDKYWDADLAKEYQSTDENAYANFKNGLKDEEADDVEYWLKGENYSVDNWNLPEEEKTKKGE